MYSVYTSDIFVRVRKSNSALPLYAVTPTEGQKRGPWIPGRQSASANSVYSLSKRSILVRFSNLSYRNTEFLYGILKKKKKK